MVVDWRCNPLRSALEVNNILSAFGDVPEEELNLFKFASRSMTEPGTRPS